MRGIQQATTPSPASNAARAEVQAQVRQTIQDANQAARDAAQAARDANQAARDAGNGFPAIPPVPGAPGVPAVPHPGGAYTIQNDNGNFNGMPPQVADISIAFFVMCAVMVIGWPISRAFGRRIERRGAASALSAGSTEQLQRIEQAVEAMSIEIERISESQRFMAKLQSANVADGEARGVKLTS